MPRTFMDSILQRPSQRYAPEPVGPAVPSSASSSRGPSAAHRWPGPTDLPNRPAGPSSLLACNPAAASASSAAATSAHQPCRTYASAPPPPAPSSVADSQGTTRSRFGTRKKKKKQSHSRDQSQSQSSYGTAPMDGHASNAGSNATYTKRRWWDAGSLFGKGSRSRAASVMGESVAGESVFSEPARTGGSAAPASVQQRQYGTVPIWRGTRSDFGASTSTTPKPPPLPQHDPATLKALASGSRLQTGVAPLGQQPPTLRRNVSSSGSTGTARHSTTALPSPSLPPPRGRGDRLPARRANTVLGSSSVSDGGWDDFTKQMSNRDIARSWNRAPSSETSATRRATVLNRVQKELQQDAQFEQITRDPGVIRGDLLARATSVVGGLAPTVVGETLVPELPMNLRPGSIVGMTSLVPADASRPTSPTPLHLARAVSPPPPQARTMSPSPQPPVLSTPPQIPSHLPAQQTPVRPTAEQPEPSNLQEQTSRSDSVGSEPLSQQYLASTKEDSSHDVSSSASPSSSEEGDSSSEDDNAPQTLGVLAEEEEENGSSDGGHEMRPGPRSTYLPRIPGRQGMSQSPARQEISHSPARLPASGLNNEYSGGFAGVGARPASAIVLAEGSSAVPAFPSAMIDETTEEAGRNLQSDSQTEDSAGSSDEQSKAPVPSGLCTTEVSATLESAAPSIAATAAPLAESSSDSVPVSHPAAASVTSADPPQTPSRASMSIQEAAPALPVSWNTSDQHSPSTATPSNHSSSDGTIPVKVHATAVASPPPTTPLPRLPLRRSPIGPQPPPSVLRSDAFPRAPVTPSKNNGVIPVLLPMLTPQREGQTTMDAHSFPSSSSSDDADLTREIDADSGKDGEISSAMTTEGLKTDEDESLRGVKFEREARHDDNSDESDYGDRDSGTTTGAKGAKPKSRPLDGQGDAASVAASEATTNPSTRKTLQGRLSDASMAHSFAFSHFMGSKISGKSSSRRIKLHEDDSDSDGGASGDDEELKQQALLEQKRLRNMSVGDDFFGPSLDDVLLAIDNMDFTKATVGETAALEEEARAQGISVQETTKAQLQAQQIVSEVRRRRAAGDLEADHKTVQSEAGGLAASFAALWLQNSAWNSSDEQETKAVPKTSLPVKASAIMDSTSTWGGQSSTTTTPTKNIQRSQSIIDRPRFRPSKPRQMGGIEISDGKIADEEVRAPVDEPSTLPSVESFYSTVTHSTPSSPARAKKSLDLGDQQLSKDKPPPTKSALKVKSLRQSKSLADTLFSFPTKSPEKKEAKAAKKEEKERIRRNSLSEKAAKKAAAKEEKVANKGASGSPFGKRRETAEPSSPSVNRTSVVSPSPSLVKTQGEPDFQQTSLDGQSRDLASHSRSNRSQERRTGSSDASAPHIAARSEQVSDQTARHEGSRGGVQSSTSHDSQWSASLSRSDTESSGAIPSSDGLSAAPVSAPSKSEKAYAISESGDSSTLNLPAPQTSRGVARDPIDSSQLDHAPQAQPSFGMNLIPPTPPVISGADGNNYMTSGPKKVLSRSISSASASTVVPSRKGSMLQAAEAYGFRLPAGLTAETVATSSGSKAPRITSPHRSATLRRSSGSDGSHSPRRVSRTDLPPVPPIPRELVISTNSVQPPLPPKDDGSRRSTSGSSWDFSHQLSPAGFPNNASLTSLSPPPSTGSWAGSAAPSSTGADDSPARSGGSGSSSADNAGNSDRYGVSNMAASEVPEAHRQPARVRAQSSGPQLSRRPHLMTSINEWESASPVNGYGGSGYASPIQTSSPVDGLQRSASPCAPRSFASFQNGESPTLNRNLPLGSATEIFLHPPVPRSRKTADEKQRLAFEAHLSGSEHIYAASDGDHGGNDFGSRYSTANNSQANFGGSVDGHGNHVRGLVPRPVSIMSGYSAASVPMSLASLPTAPTSRSAYRPQDPIKAASSSTVDDRLYSRTTMATISVSSGAFASKRGAKGRSAQASTDGPARSSSEAVPEHLQDELGLTVLSLSAHTPPPRKIGSHQVLVQVIAVALDEIDRMLLRDRVRSDSAYGWVPGRSFCGRVMEVGWEVKRMRKGDMIFGLQSNRKCGALAEFMIIDQDLVAKAPEDCLTVEQIAALPSTGVLTYQIVQNHCAQLPKGSRILILNAHDGIGLLTMQECASLGLIMVAQCPTSISDGLAVCEANGAHEVVVGEPLWAMNSLHESSFDLVIDTVGGRRMYDAARRILASDGQFVTCFGDEHSSANPNFKSHMRSLRRTFFKKDKKNLRYEWTGLENAEDCKEALESVRAVAENGDICPRLRSILPLEDAPRAFDPVTKGGVAEAPGAVVVRVS